jgi:hypothetical protein
MIKITTIITNTNIKVGRESIGMDTGLGSGGGGISTARAEKVKPENGNEKCKSS